MKIKVQAAFETFSKAACTLIGDKDLFLVAVVQRIDAVSAVHISDFAGNA